MLMHSSYGFTQPSSCLIDVFLQLFDLSFIEEDMKNAFLSELKERIRDELIDEIIDADNGGEGGDLGGRPQHKMLPPSMMNGFSGVNDLGSRY